jgi:hypothetical protein
LTAIAIVLAVSVFMTAFGRDSVRTSQSVDVPRSLAAAPGRPAPTVIAVVGTVRLQQPVAATTAVGVHAGSEGSLPLHPVGRQANEGGIARLAHKIFGGGGNGMRWYQLGGEGVANGAIDIGATPGTEVYAPVDGIVVGVTPFVLNGDSRRYGVRLDIQPQVNPSVVVSLTHVRLDPSVRLGQTVIAGVTKVGTVVDLSSVERQALARYTRDAGNNVSIEVRQAATLTLN